MTNPQPLAEQPFPLHVGFVVNNFPPHVGGVEQHVLALAKELVNLGAKVTVATLGPLPGREAFPGLEIIEVKGTPAIGGVMAWPYPGATRKLARLFRSKGVNVVSVHTRFFPFTFIGIRIARHLRIPAILTEHGSDFVRGVSPLVAAGSRLVDFTFGRYTLRRASLVLAISSATEPFVRRLADVPSSLFFNAIHTKVFRPTEQSLEAPRKLVFLGRLVPGKGWERVIDVASELANHYPDLETHIVGDGPDRERVEEYARASVAGDSISVHGFMDASQFREILKNSILLNPTTLAEGFQTTLLEAIAAGASVVSTRQAAAEFLGSLGAPVILRDPTDEAGWADAVKQLLASPAPRIDDSLLEKFDWGERARQYQSLASKLASGSR